MKIDYLRLVFISYTVSFIVYHLIPDRLEEIHLKIGNLHIHHCHYGMIILVVGYYLAIKSQSIRTKVKLAVLCGFSLFLVADEIEMLLWLKPTMSDDPLLRMAPGLIVMAIFPIIMLIKKLFK